MSMATNMMNQIDDRRFNVIDSTPYVNKTEAYENIKNLYSQMSGMTTYPVKDEDGETRHIIVQYKALM